MKNLIIKSLFLLCLFVVSHNAKSEENVAVKGLISRIMPGYENQLLIKLDATASKNYYKIYASEGKVCIEGNTPTSIASGLHRYLKDYLNTSVSWTNFQPLLSSTLPLPTTTTEAQSPYNVVTYLNYCAFGYTTTYWDWERWEKEIDWMALNGITHPLAMTGAEKVWLNFLKKANYTDAEAKQFLCGPAYMPWLLMGNMESFGGPMPDEWFDRQVALQKKILERMRSYGMSPILQGFYGMVPTNFKTKNPTVTTIAQGSWSGNFTRPHVLSPLDSKFKDFAEIWYEESEALFGKADYYAGDLFHEGGLTGGLDVAACAREVQNAMLAHNPNAIWAVQSWGSNPTAALMNGLSKEKSVIIELCAEYWSRWKDTNGYNGIPWVWSNISNWGGNIGSHGRLDAIATQPIAARNHTTASKSLVGIGFTPEGIETNPIVPDLWADMIWTTQSPNMQNWINRYAKYRYNSSLPSVQEAWQGFYKTIYGSYASGRRPPESVFCANPSLNVTKVSAWWSTAIYYDPAALADACEKFLADAGQLKNNKNYQYDVLDVVRQCIADLGRHSYAAIQSAHKNKDKAAFDKEVQFFLQLIQYQDELLLTHPDFCLYPWLEKARNAGTAQSAKDLYELHNRQMVTSWRNSSTDLNDYAHREIGGLLGTYYYQRWKTYLDALTASWPNTASPDIFNTVTKPWWTKDISNDIKLSGKDPVETAIAIFNTLRQHMKYGVDTEPAEILEGVEFYIENASSPYKNEETQRIGKLLTDQGGSSSTVSAWFYALGGTRAEKNNQIWTVTKNQQTGLYKLKNKGTGKGIRFNVAENKYYSTSNPAEEVEFEIVQMQTETATGLRFVSLKPVTETGNAYLSCNNADFNAVLNEVHPVGILSSGLIKDDYDGIPTAWKFIPAETYESYFPKMSVSGGESYWYYIENNNSHTGKVIAVGDDSGADMKLMQKYDYSDDKQLWRFFSNSTNTNNRLFVKIESKAYPGYYMEQTKLKLNTTPGTSVSIRNMREGKLAIGDNYAAGKGIYVNTSGNLSWDNAGSATATSGLYSKTTETRWKFVPVDDQTAIVEIEKDKFVTWVENGLVKHTGTCDSFKIYNTSGCELSINSKLSSGIYIVKLDQKTIKVIVK